MADEAAIPEEHEVPVIVVAEPLGSVHAVKAEGAAGHHLMFRLGGQRS